LHLKTGAWYWYCTPDFTLPPEVPLKLAVDSQKLLDDIPRFANLNDKAKVKAMKKEEEVDRKIALKNLKAVEKAKEKITKKALKFSEASEASGAKKTKGKSSTQKIPSSSTKDEGSEHRWSTSWRTKRDAEYISLSNGGMVYGPSAVEFLVDSEISISEFIINYSLANVLANPLPKVYHDIMSFTDKVSVFIYVLEHLWI